MLVVEIESSSLSIILNVISDEIVLMVDGELVVNSRIIINLSFGFFEREGGRGGFSSSFLKISTFLIEFESVDDDDEIGLSSLMNEEEEE